MMAQHYRIEYVGKEGIDKELYIKVLCRYCGFNVFKEKRFPTWIEAWRDMLSVYKVEGEYAMDLHLMECKKYEDSLHK